jgi:ADP-ribose pyrophosphatase YjhB (NUDIX family)
VGVGAVVLHRGRVLLVRRGTAPAAGRWSLPGGVVDLGERLEEAVQREVREECGLEVEVAGVAGVVDRIVRDSEGRVRYHWVLIDYLAYAAEDTVTPGSDAADCRWVDPARLGELETTEGLAEMVRRALALAEARRLQGASS